MTVDVILIRLLISILLGAALGMERELQGRPAGLRTHTLVSLGAALVMLISMYGFEGTNDPARLAAQVVSGIGFLGAGAILRDGGDIKGITTAATLWMAAIIGLAAGNGYFVGAIAATFASVVILVLLRSLETFLGKRTRHLTIITSTNKPVLQVMVQACDRRGLVIANIEAHVTDYGKEECIKFSADFASGSRKEDIESVIFEVTEILNPLSIFIK